jgi:hypothetical protein
MLRIQSMDRAKCMCNLVRKIQVKQFPCYFKRKIGSLEYYAQFAHPPPPPKKTKR